MKTGPLAAIKSYCYWCCGDSHEEATLCPAVECPIHSLRKGVKPADFGKPVLKAIRERCLDCSGFQINEVKNCWDNDCALYPFRMGKNPNRRVSPHQTPSQEDMSQNKTVSKGKVTQKSYEQGEVESPQILETGINNKESLKGE